MNHKTKTHRILSWLPAMCMIVGLLPAQAFAASIDDDPSTWPAPDEQYTAPDKNPVYLYLDFTDEDNGGIRAAHYCTTGAEMTNEIVKATTTTDGYVKYTCNTCGGWAQINVPALTLDAFELDPAYRSAVDNGVEYSGNVYTLVYNIKPAMQRYVGPHLENHVAITAPGTYNIRITVDGSIYDNVQLVTEESLTVRPKGIPWTATFDSKIYDGVSLLDGISVTYQDVEGNTVPAALSAYLMKVENGEMVVDSASPATQPVAAGPYAISATITDALIFVF